MQSAVEIRGGLRRQWQFATESATPEAECFHQAGLRRQPGKRHHGLQARWHSDWIRNGSSFYVAFARVQHDCKGRWDVRSGMVERAMGSCDEEQHDCRHGLLW